MTSVTYSTIYEKVTKNANVLVGALAYIIYKQQKVEFCKTTSGGNPSQENMDCFHVIASLDASVTAYRLQAEAMAQAILNEGLDDFVQRVLAEAQQDVLHSHIEDVSTDLKAQLATVNKTLDAKRTWAGWIRDVGGNLMVNVVTILVIGVLVLGYKFIGEIQQTAEIRAGLGSGSVLVDSAADG